MTVQQSLIVGPGAIGSLVCAQAQALGTTQVYQHRAELALASKLLQPEHITPLQWQLQHDAASAPDFIWICCKAFHVKTTTEKLLAQYPKAVVILLNNGMGPQQTLAARYPKNIIIGSTTCGALRTEPTNFQQTSFGETLLELTPNDQAYPKLSAIFQTPPLQLQAVDNITPHLWRKLLVNSCVNPLTGALQITNGELMRHDLQNEIAILISEFAAIYRASQGMQIDDAHALVKRVITNSRHNWSSMAMDVKQQRCTEIDYINGFLLQQAEQYQVRAPRIGYWYERIATLKEY